MAKKKTKKTGAKPVGDARSKRRDLDDAIRKLEERQALRAIDRAKVWTRLLNQLEELLDHADTLFTMGLPVDYEHVEKEYSRQREEGLNVTFGDVRKEQEFVESCLLAQDLQLAENWLPMIGSEYRSGDLHAIADVRGRLNGELRDPFSTPAESLATAIVCVRMLLAVDLRRARGFVTVPKDEDLDVLRRLKDKPKTAKELAVEIAGKGNPHAVDEKRVERAIERLRDVHGFELPNDRGSGYSLSKSDRARLDATDRGT